MGAFGAALIAREREEETGDTQMLSIDEIINLEYSTSMSRCQGCNNHCILTINKFNNDRQFISGNRCERGLGLERIMSMYQTFTNININEFLDIKH